MKRILLFIVALLFSGLALAAVNINTATKEELEALNGIGPVKAQAIIDYRNANGPFKSPEDIMKVKGIKEGEFGKIRNDIAVSGVTTPVAPAKGEKAAPSKASQAPSAPMKSAEKAAPAPAKDTTAKDATAKDATADKSAKAGSDKDAKAKAKEEKAAKAKADKEAKTKAKEEKAAKAKADKEAKAKAKDEKAAKSKDTGAKKEDEAAKAKK